MIQTSLELRTQPPDDTPIRIGDHGRLFYAWENRNTDPIDVVAVDKAAAELLAAEHFGCRPYLVLAEPWNR